MVSRSLHFNKSFRDLYVERVLRAILKEKLQTDPQITNYNYVSVKYSVRTEQEAMKEDARDTGSD